LVLLISLRQKEQAASEINILPVNEGLSVSVSNYKLIKEKN